MLGQLSSLGYHRKVCLKRNRSLCTNMTCHERLGRSAEVNNADGVNGGVPRHRRSPSQAARASVASTIMATFETLLPTRLSLRPDPLLSACHLSIRSHRRPQRRGWVRFFDMAWKADRASSIDGAHWPPRTLSQVLMKFYWARSMHGRSALAQLLPTHQPNHAISSSLCEQYL